MNHLKDLTGKGEIFANPMFVLSVSKDFQQAGCTHITVADGGAINTFRVIGSTVAIAQHIDDLIDEIVNEEFDGDGEDENYGDE